MPLLLTGQEFRRDLERDGALALFVPLEGGAETRLMRRLRAVGYKAYLTSAKGLGDPEAYLLKLHEQHVPHLGRRMSTEGKPEGKSVGHVPKVMPMLGPLLEGKSPILLWLLEGQVLSSSELSAISNLPKREPRLKIVVEMGGARALRWESLGKLVESR
uniref:NAD(P)H-quinone oxidoreductase subunit N, organellar chromatophore n=1 Tax=Paulinella chromatophora TaxID=39717 RepID=NDHN_PAUCH|nr:hypothetical protein PCC_0598 [Paulinella chromatophora]B1X509.1 RecName: Full=NAD(P)H-quinone oxidoreductase subunit N, organellar chromatophore; AltName: Full=NAD(P)H dehydrogenase I subunit N; Short=NDH-1 subunit N; Short=NDH-N [Paulinella chromatophora]ACB43028.1 hypothetical protein PCC_0598 [Paulinella chromatophora]